VNEIKFNKSEVNLKQLNKNKTKRAMDSSSSTPILLCVYRLPYGWRAIALSISMV